MNPRCLVYGIDNEFFRQIPTAVIRRLKIESDRRDGEGNSEQHSPPKDTYDPLERMASIDVRLQQRVELIPGTNVVEGTPEPEGATVDPHLKIFLNLTYDFVPAILEGTKLSDILVQLFGASVVGAALNRHVNVI